jgi:acetyl-CoA carboxylase biotin carboxylase subunit
MIRRLLIANRGEIALRIVRACRELNIESVAVHSDVDALSPHVLVADHAVAIGAAPAADSYLSIPRVIAAARSSRADAIHPGYGFLSENPAFASACLDAGVIFVGPPAGVMEKMGSKIQARRVAVAAGAPVVPGETPSNQTNAGLRQTIERVGLPALIKASAGGGGRGMRIVRDHGDGDAAIDAARREATSAFGDGTLYVERLIEGARHVEIQILADDHGRVLHLFERDCSVQRRHQKVIEESPSPALTADLRTRMTEAAVAIARAASYRNAGTIEFLVSDGAFYFLEMNTRLQVEHPVTEEVAGVDLVRAQLLVASGEALPWTQHQLVQRGHAIEARVYAEDPGQGFLPQAGPLLLYRQPHLPGVRIDSGVVEGGAVSVYYDAMIAKVIATAETRALAIRKLAAALRDFPILGVRTNMPYLLRILEHPQFANGTIDTGFLDRQGASLIDADDEVPEQVRAVANSRQSSVDSRQSTVVGPEAWDPWDR